MPRRGHKMQAKSKLRSVSAILGDVKTIALSEEPWAVSPMQVLVVGGTRRAFQTF
jgi:hypothetical protein